MSSMVRFSSWKVNPPTLRTMEPINWFAACGQRMPLRPGRGLLGALLHAEEPVGVQPQAPEPRSTSECIASPITSRMPAKVGSSQLMDGWPALK